MHKLSRQVRFSINPFLDSDGGGDNSYSSKPCGEGLALFFDLGVGVVGQADGDTGFVINVMDIDKRVRDEVVPIYSEYVRKYYRAGRHIGYENVSELLELAYKHLSGKLGGAMISDLSLNLNPFRKISVDCEDLKMIYIGEKFEFAAMHKLWNEKFDDAWNFEAFGKCANPTGHGHNYVVEVTVKAASSDDFSVGAYEKIVEENFISLVDHKNLNADVEFFAKANPTVENLAVYAWQGLVGKFDKVKLHSITVWETDKTYCTYYG